MGTIKCCCCLCKVVMITIIFFIQGDTLGKFISAAPFFYFVICVIFSLNARFPRIHADVRALKGLSAP